MPKITPMDDIKPLSEAIQVHRNEYDSGDTDYSVTTLLDPPRVVMLNKRHLHKVKLHVSDLLHSYNGTGAHAYMEYCLKKSLKSKWECETRLRMTVNNRKISGAFDFLWEQQILYDLKTTSVWKVRWGSKKDWTGQQNIYRYMYKRDRNIDIQKLIIVGLFRDWSKGNLMRAGKNTPGQLPRRYPAYPAQQYELPLWNYNDTLDFVTERVNTMIKHEETPDDDLPECSYEDMWSEPDSVAVIVPRLKSRALRVLSSKAAAENFVEKHLANPKCKDKITDITYQIRPAIRKRCEEWCPVNRYCNQYQKHLANLAKIQPKKKKGKK